MKQTNKEWQERISSRKKKRKDNGQRKKRMKKHERREKVKERREERGGMKRSEAETKRRLSGRYCIKDECQGVRMRKCEEDDRKEREIPSIT